ncbi:MAG: type IV pilus twitching motility protein PilT [Akkermansiaceae bacterium]
MAIIDLFKALKQESVSDVFLTEGKAPMVRRLGQLDQFADQVITREDLLAFFADCLPPNTWERLVAERDLDLGFSVSSEERFRLNLGFELGAISVVGRKVPSGAMQFDELGLPDVVETLAQEPRGLILVTGSTGSGKSTTMAAMLHYINSHFKKHIVTIEDPIEFVHREEKSHITQREIGSDTRDFGRALRAVVRQSPDVIFIGELRDFETIQTALAAAMTGHLVISTLHTVDAEQTLERMLNYVPDGQRHQFALDLSLALKGIISQRLLTRKDDEGMIPAVECLINTPHVAKLIAGQKIEQIGEAMKSGSSEGMVNFNRVLIKMVEQEIITPDTALNAADKRDELQLLMQGMETGIDTLRAGDAVKGVVTTSMKSLLKSALHYGASDMLISAGNVPILRVNGELLKTNAGELNASDTRNLLFSLLNRRQRADFEENKEIDFALSVTLPDGHGNEGHHRFRVNGFYQKGTVSCAIRVINQRIPDAAELGLPIPVIDMINNLNGLVLITGPTGQGKSTTLACLIDQINRTRSCHVITIEDPIEYVHKNRKAVIEQRELHADTLSYQHAMKYVLRQDPDVILIGEMRDPETIAAALTAAETGHLVLATLHTNDAVQTIDRIIDSFPAHHQNQIRSQFSACLVGIVAQRLLPRMDGKGRIGVFEILKGSLAVRANIRDNKTHLLKGAMETAQKDGMMTMDMALEHLYEKGLISEKTVRSVAQDKEII